MTETQAIFINELASNRRQRNRIKGLRNASGQWVTDQAGFEEIITSYYHNLFTSEGVNTQAAELILNTTPTRVSEDMNLRLPPLILMRKFRLLCFKYILLNLLDRMVCLLSFFKSTGRQLDLMFVWQCVT